VTASVWLIDKSALIRLPTSSARDEWYQRIERGLIHVTTLTLLEIGYSARSGADGGCGERSGWPRLSASGEST